MNFAPKLLAKDFILRNLLSPLGLACSISVLTLLKCGIGISGNAIVLLTVAQNWTAPLSFLARWPDSSVVLRSPVQALLAGIFGFTTAPKFILFNLPLIALAFILPFTFKICRASLASRLSLFLLLIGTGVSSQLLAWVGIYDTPSVIVIEIALLSANRYARMIG